MQIKAMKRVMEYCLGTRESGLVLEPDHSCDCDPDFELLVLGQSGSDYAKDPETRERISGTSTFLCGHPSFRRA